MNFLKKKYEALKPNGTMKSEIKLTLLITLFVGFISQAQSIEKFSIDSGGAVASAGNIQIMYTIGEVNVAERTSATISVSEGFISSSLKIKISPLAFLQGPLLIPATPGLMNDILREDNFLPTTSPYSDGATVNASVFTTTGDNAIVDWVWVELRNDTDPTEVINGKSALLQRDGDIVAINGTSELTMPVAPKSYYVAIKHRNHLGAISASPIALSETTATVDFTDSTFSTLGANSQVILASGDTALWAGDVNGNNQVRYLGPGNDSNAIKDNVLNPINGNPSGSNFYPYTGYDSADIDMNGTIRYLGPNNDTSKLKDIILTHPNNGTLSNFFPIISGIPN